MNEPQVWTLIGVFTTIMLGAMSLMTVQINRTLSASIDGLRAEMTGRMDGLQGEMTGRMDGLQGEMRAGFAAVDLRFAMVDTKIEHLDREVVALNRRMWGGTAGG